MKKSPALLVLCLALAASCARKDRPAAPDPAEDWERPLRAITEGFQTADPSIFLSAGLPKVAEAVRTMFTEESLGARRAFLESEYGGSLVFGYRVLGKEALDEAALREAEDWYLQAYEASISLDAGWKLAVEYRFGGSEAMGVDTDDVTVVRSSGLWYLTEY